MSGKTILRRLPGVLTTILMTLFAAAWTYWGVAEMYHEGWWGAWWNKLVYLIPPAISLLLALAALRWPRVGGVTVILAGLVFTWWWFDPRIESGRLVVDRAWSSLLFSGSLILIGLLFWLDGHLRRRFPPPTQEDDPRRWVRLLRHWRYLLVSGLPLLIGIGISAYNLPRVLTRLDDRDRGARLIDGNGVSLVWAPEGPGWNYKQAWGGYPSWNAVALYGREPVGLDEKSRDMLATDADMAATNLCRYLSADGLSLLDEPQDIWRMPTTDELARSLVRDGAHAGCAWDGSAPPVRLDCTIQPDKETPLWDPTAAPIYYWALESYGEDEAYFVSHNGWVNAAYRRGGNPRHSYRCVRDP